MIKEARVSPFFQKDGVVVAQLLERSILTPEICSSNQANGKFYLLSNVFNRPKLKKKRPGMGLFLKKDVRCNNHFSAVEAVCF